MKQYKWALFVIVNGSLALFGAVASAAESRASEVEVVIGNYFKAFYSKNLDGMVALSAPTIKIVDYGQSFDIGEWSWFMKFTFENRTLSTSMATYDVKLSDFTTKIQSDIAYTSFQMHGGDPDYPEIANAVLKRVDGKWRIDYLSIEKQRDWQRWLRDRVTKGQDVSNWFEDYSKEHP